ncbi:MAG: protein-disulfide reductase DsbD, partial [Betaproteobacteria bacterium]|nr:protein-disulfide reductase DsbD [Betaproteobacteria bacterium]
DQAFKFSVRPLDGKTLEVRYDIADGYYMYRERFKFAAEPSSVKLGDAQIPPGHIKYDDTFKKNVEHYRHSVVITLPVLAASGPFKLIVTGQGCADKGLCYPPQDSYAKVELTGFGGATNSAQAMSEDDINKSIPALLSTAVAQNTPGSNASVQPVSTAAADKPLPKVENLVSTKSALDDDTARIDSALKSGNPLIIVPLFLAFGLLLSFTPCVLPMIPILSSIIVGEGNVSRAKGFGMALTYSLGMALVYTTFGVVAGILGEGLAAALQKPWVLLLFAALLVTLAFSMFGFYELQMPNFIQSKVNEASGKLQGGKLAGVFIMGGLSALIVGPCVAAPLAGTLVFISQTKNAFTGGLALFSLAAGMSVPLLLVGLSAGSLLPKAGGWMEKVKYFFGALLIAVAIWMINPVIPTWLTMLLWAGLLIVSASYLRVFDPLAPDASGWSKLFKGVGVVLAVMGAALVVGAASGGRDVLQPLAQLSGGGGGGKVAAGPHGLQFSRVKTVQELDARIAEAGKSGRPVMLDFYADWCVSCKEMERFTFADAQVQGKLANALLLQADVTANSADDKALLKRFNLFGPPGIIFFDGKGQEVGRVIGFQPADKFLASLSVLG